MAEEQKNSPARQEKEEKLDKIKVPDSLPVLVLRDIVVFPYMIVPLYVGRAKSKKAVDAALNNDRLILLLTQKDMNVEDPGEEQLYQSGTVALIVRMLKLPDGRMRVLIQGISRVKVRSLIDDGKILQAEVIQLEDEEPENLTLENKAMIKNVRQKFEQVSKLGKQISNEILVIAENIEEPGKLADIIASNLELKIEESQKILEEKNSLGRLAKVHEYLNYEIEMLNMQNQINLKAQGEMDKNQKEYFLRQQLKAIRKELGEEAENIDEINGYLKKLEEAKMPEAARKETEKNIDRLKKMHPESAESTVTRTYLDWMFELPWGIASKDNMNLKRAKSILNQDHYGLEKVKERILEYLSVRKLTSQGPRTDPVLRRPARCRQNVPGQIHRPRPE